MEDRFRSPLNLSTIPSSASVEIVEEVPDVDGGPKFGRFRLFLDSLNSKI